MLKKTIVVAALFLTPTLCEAADLRPYLGASISQDVEIEAGGDVETESSGTSFKLFGGVSFGEHLAAELAYHDFGTTTCCGPAYADLGFERTGDAFSVSAVASWPISRFSLFARAGASWWSVDGHDLTIQGLRPYSNDGVDPTVGAGVDVTVLSGLRLRLEWEHLEIDDGSDDAVSIGALWQF